MLNQNLVNLVYLLAAILFILDLKWMSHPRTAVRGNSAGAIAMVIAIAATLLSERFDWPYILVGISIGAVIGAGAAMKVKMTAMPEMVGLFNGFGGGASVLVAGSALLAVVGTNAGELSMQMRVATVVSGVIGSVTFFGSYVAFGKLAEFLAVKWELHTWQKIIKYGFSVLVAAGGFTLAWAEDFRPLALILFLCALMIAGMLLVKKSRFPGMDVIKIVTVLLVLGLAVVVVFHPENALLFWAMVGVAGILGVTLTLSIGGADMPVVIALLNSYSGLAAAATGFVIDNTILIISGSLVGASGIILTNIMCKAMNRSLANVLFATMGPTADTPDADEVYHNVTAAAAEEVAMMLDGAQRVVIVPGYGMAVAQAQHVVRDLSEVLEAGGATVEFAIHPVAGRMPGHMNVLLAEADVPYEKLLEMDEINPTLAQVDVAIVVGANDVVNPVARTDPKSPIAGMPIIDVDKARTVVVIKRSLSPGFAGIPNPLFAASNTVMLFDDAKKAILDLLVAIKEG